MKKILILIGGLLAFLLLVAILLPLLFQGKITSLLNRELNKNLNARVELSEVRLSLFRSFPDASLRIGPSQIIGVGLFNQDTLLSFSSFRVAIPLPDLIRGKQLSLNEVSLESPQIHLVISPEGLANWEDILKPDNAPEANEQDTASATFRAQLQEANITGGTLTYSDRKDPMEFEVKGVDLTMEGDMGAEQTLLSIRGEAAPLNYKIGNISWISKARVQLHTELDANMKDQVFRFRESQVQINDLALTVEGSFSGTDDGWNTDLTFVAPQSDFKSLLSLIPSMYQSDFENLKTEGELNFNGYIRGLISEDRLPDVGIDIAVHNGMFQYPELPDAARNIRLDANIFYDGSGQDQTYVIMDPFHIELGENPFDAKWEIRTPETDMHISGEATGTINFSTLNQIIPMDGLTIKGLLETDLRFSGFMSAIENEEYDKFNTAGTAHISDFEYLPVTSTPAEKATQEATDAPVLSIRIPEARAEFTSRQINIQELSARIGNSQMDISGYIRNYFPYLFKGGTLTGNLSFVSDRMDLNEFMTETPDDVADSTASVSVIEIPKQIDITLRSRIREVILGQVRMQQVTGTVVLRNQQAILEGLNMNMFGGSALLTGSYDSRNPALPLLDLNTELKDWNLLTTLTTFEKTLGKLFPNPENYSGTLSARLSLNSPLDLEMSPILSLLTANGNITSNQITIRDAPVLQALGKALREEDRYNDLMLNDLNIPFEAKNNRISLKPFTIKINSQLSVELSGDQGFDQTLNYTVRMTMPASYLGSDFTRIMGGQAAAAAQTVRVSGHIGGTLKTPEVKLNTQETLGNVAGALAGQLLNRLTPAPANTSDSLDTRGLTPENVVRADSILQKAKIQADQIRQQAEAQANKLIQDAAERNAFQKAAATVQATLIRNDAEKEAQKIMDAAATQINALRDSNPQ